MKTGNEGVRGQGSERARAREGARKKTREREKGGERQGERVEKRKGKKRREKRYQCHEVQKKATPSCTKLQSNVLSDHFPSLRKSK